MSWPKRLSLVLSAFWLLYVVIDVLDTHDYFTERAVEEILTRGVVPLLLLWGIWWVVNGFRHQRRSGRHTRKTSGDVQLEAEAQESISPEQAVEYQPVPYRQELRGYAKKSPGLAVVLCLLFGPFGLFYLGWRHALAGNVAYLAYVILAYLLGLAFPVWMGYVLLAATAYWAYTLCISRNAALETEDVEQFALTRTFPGVLLWAFNVFMTLGIVHAVAVGIYGSVRIIQEGEMLKGLLLLFIGTPILAGTAAFVLGQLVYGVQSLVMSTAEGLQGRSAHIKAGWIAAIVVFLLVGGIGLAYVKASKTRGESSPGKVTTDAIQIVDFSGTWLIECRIDETNYQRFQGLKVTYTIEMQQEGNHVSGNGYKIRENNEPIQSESARVPIYFEGQIKDGELVVTYTLQGSQRTTEGVFRWRMAEDTYEGSSYIVGTFTSPSATSSGMSWGVRTSGS